MFNIYTHINIPTHIHTYKHVYIQTYLPTYFLHTNIHTYIHTNIHTCLHIDTSTYLYIYIRTHIHTCIRHGYIHTKYIRPYTQTSPHVSFSTVMRLEVHTAQVSTWKCGARRHGKQDGNGLTLPRREFSTAIYLRIHEQLCCDSIRTQTHVLRK